MPYLSVVPVTGSVPRWTPSTGAQRSALLLRNRRTFENSCNSSEPLNEIPGPCSRACAAGRRAVASPWYPRSVRPRTKFRLPMSLRIHKGENCHRPSAIDSRQADLSRNGNIAVREDQASDRVRNETDDEQHPVELDRESPRLAVRENQLGRVVGRQETQVPQPGTWFPK